MKFLQGIIILKIYVIDINDVNIINDSSFEWAESRSIVSKITPYQRYKTIKVGLIKDRHPMPVNKYIFEEEIDSDSMFNYKHLDSIISQFILNNINIKTVDNVCVADKSLCVYVTGLQCALASLIKICSNYNVPLTLMHYNIATDSYESQVIFKSNDTILDVDSFSCIPGDIYFTENCPNYEVAKKSDFIYLLKETRRKKEDNGYLNLVSENTYIFKDVNLAWEEYLNICKKASWNNSEEISIYLDKGIINNNDSYVRSDTLARSYNFVRTNYNFEAEEERRENRKYINKQNSRFKSTINTRKKNESICRILVEK